MYDVIVVGARCAGAPTAMLLARRGYRVLLVDRAEFPSDQPMSTHLIYPPGILRLRRWGLLDQVRASNCPPITDFGLRTEAFDLLGASPPAEDVAEAYAPRRYVLDGLLVDAAVEAGAVLRPDFSVQGLVRDESGAVIGIRGQTASGPPVVEHARVVVGADGTRSSVARWVEAEEYNARPTLLGNWWTYWRGTGQQEVLSFAGDYRYSYAWPTNDDCTLVGVAWPMKDFRELSPDVETEYFAALELIAPEMAERLRECERAERWIRGSVRNFFRKPYGAGWALVGDASYSKDPCTAAGITDAFHDVELLVDALDQGLGGQRPMLDALAHYEQLRNTKAVPFYEFICQFATLERYPPEMTALFQYIQDDPAETRQLIGLFAQTVSPAEFFAPDNVARLVSLVGSGNAA